MKSLKTLFGNKSWLALALVGVAACSADQTQLVVVVNSDISVPSVMDHIRVTATSLSGSGNASTGRFDLASEQVSLPFSFGVAPVNGNPDSGVTLEFQVYGSRDVLLFTRKVITGFKASESLRLPVFLTENCLALTCADGQTCTEEGCQSPEIPASTLQSVPQGEELDVEWPMDTVTDAGVNPDATVSPDASVVPDATVTPDASVNPDGGTANRAPSAPSIEIQPANPTTSDDLECVVTTPAQDPEGENVTYIYSFVKLGSAVMLTSSQVNSSETSRDDAWRCIVSATDGMDTGTSTSVDVAIQNSIPTMTGLEVDPPDGRETTSFTCTGLGFNDADNDREGYDYQWYVDGNASVTTASIDGTSFDRGDDIRCDVRANDGQGGVSMVSSSALIRIDNTLPTAPTATITPSSPDETEDLTCAVLSPSTDPDPADAMNISYSYSWSNGMASYAGAILLAANTSVGETWTCTITPEDGVGPGPTGQASVTVGSSVAVCSSLSFDGVNDYVEVPSSSSFAFGSSDFAIEAWFQVSGWPASGFHDIVSVLDPGLPEGRWRLAYYNNQIIFIVRANPGYQQMTAAAPMIGAWHHVAVSRSGNQFRLFVDGVESADSTFSNALNIQSSATLRIGGHSGFEWDGQIDEVRLSSVARYTSDFTPNRILVSDVNTIALWNFDETTGTVANDFSGNGHHGTINGATWSNSCPANPDGASCQAILTARPFATDGTYRIDPDGVGGNAAFEVYCDMTTDGGGWTLVRRNAGPGWSANPNDDLAGTSSYGTGTPSPTSQNSFGVAFQNILFSHMRFATGDEQRWLIVERSEVYSGWAQGMGACNELVTILSSHVSSSAYSIDWCKRRGAQEDPLISATDHNLGGQPDHSMLYADGAGANGWSDYVNNRQGANVWVRGTAPPSCQVILTANPSAADGTYWIDPDGVGGNAAFEVYCQMSKGGIEWIQSTVNNLYFNRSEVTVEQYEACVTGGICSGSNYRTTMTEPGCNYGNSGRTNHPMNCVSQIGGVDYCNWIGGRLPTESEWYVEASNNGARQYPWGNTPPASCTHVVMDNASGTAGCGANTTGAVCSKPLGNSVSGLCDMSGNVWEWTSTVTTGNSTSRVARGGSWWTVQATDYLTTDSRNAGATLTGVRYGFRCVSVSAP